MVIVSLICIILLIAIDQFSKYLCVHLLEPVGTVEIIKNLLNFTYSENRGAAFGILQNQRIFFVVVTVIFLFIAFYLLFYYKEHNFWSKFAGILIIAGGIGNLIDRIKVGYVVDFISVSFFPPIFNFADCCVVVGAIALFLHVLLTPSPKKKGNADEQNDSDNSVG